MTCLMKFNVHVNSKFCAVLPLHLPLRVEREYMYIHAHCFSCRVMMISRFQDSKHIKPEGHRPVWQHLHKHMTGIVTTIHIHVCTHINYFE